MKPVIYLVSVLAIGAGVFFTLSTKSKLEEQIEVRKDMEERGRRVGAQVDKTEQELKAEKESLREAQSERAQAEESIATLQGDLNRLQRELGEVESVLARHQQVIAEAEAGMKQAEDEFRRLGVDPAAGVEGIAQAITGLEDQKKALMSEISEVEALIEGAENAIQGDREEIQRLAARQVERESRARNNSMSSVVTAVDQNWGFVVIGAGRNSGFTPQKRLIVQRDGRRIAEVKPSSVESTQTIAEIDFDTVAPGVAIQPGDRVIYSEAN